VPRSWSLLSLAALAAIVAAPPWLAWQAGATWLQIAAGALVWAASVGAKIPIYRALRRPLAAMTLPWVAATQGVASAACELAAAAAWLTAMPPASLVDAIGFGVGAGSAEAGYVLGLAAIGPRPSDETLAAWMRGARASWCVRYAVPIERLFAAIGHLGSRGLIYLALGGSGGSGGGGAAAWALPAVVLFSLIDGIAVYGTRRGWLWHEPPVCRAAHATFATLGCAELLLFVIAAAH
jgi:hypothetical protein